MKTGRLRKLAGFWKECFFMGNVCKMRKALMRYLQEEGVKCELSDGEIAFDYSNGSFCASFGVVDGMGECCVVFQCEDEDYAKLDPKDKALMADRVNIGLYNHATVYAEEDVFTVKTSFYFTNRKRMINLFTLHFDELNQSVSCAVEELLRMIDENKKNQERRIGFHIGTHDDDDDPQEEAGIASKR